jgi:hypothetical protein
MKTNFNNKESDELKNIMEETNSKKHFNDIKSFMTQDDCKQVFKLKCSEGNPEELRKWILENKEIQFDLTQGLLVACVNGNLANVKYFIETPEIRKNVNLYVPYQSGPPQYVSDGVLLHSHFEGHEDIVDYLLYNVKFDVSRDTVNYLKFHQLNELLNKVEKRDLFVKMSEEMIKPEEKEKKSKPKL